MGENRRLGRRWSGQRRNRIKCKALRIGWVNSHWFYEKGLRAFFCALHFKFSLSVGQKQGLQSQNHNKWRAVKKRCPQVILSWYGLRSWVMKMIASCGFAIEFKDDINDIHEFSDPMLWWKIASLTHVYILHLHWQEQNFEAFLFVCFNAVAVARPYKMGCLRSTLPFLSQERIYFLRIISSELKAQSIWRSSLTLEQISL